jgi:hypothetical protein
VLRKKSVRRGWIPVNLIEVGAFGKGEGGTGAAGAEAGGTVGDGAGADCSCKEGSRNHVNNLVKLC